MIHVFVGSPDDSSLGVSNALESEMRRYMDLSGDCFESCTKLIAFLLRQSEKSDCRSPLLATGAANDRTSSSGESELLKTIVLRLKKEKALKLECDRNLKGSDLLVEETGGLERMLSDRSAIRYKKKEIIFREEDPIESVFFLNGGRVKAYKANAEAKEYVTDLYKRGDFFGYVSLLQSDVYMESAVALEECEVRKIAKDDFTKLIYQNRDVARRFMTILAGNVSRKRMQLLSLAYDSVRKRVASALVSIQKLSADAESLKIRVNREDLAAMTGAAAETVTRSLNDLKADKLIEVDAQGMIAILDLQGLRNLKG